MGWVMGIGKGVCYCEYCEMCKADDSQTCTSGANNTLCINNEKKIQHKKMSCLFLEVLPFGIWLIWLSFDVGSLRGSRKVRILKIIR